MSKQQYIEKVLKTHTLRIELIDGQELLYRLEHEDKEELEKWFRYRVEDDHESGAQFCSFYSCGRVVYVNIKDIARIIFCWDLGVVLNEHGYHDNFNVIIQDGADSGNEENDDLFLPPAIIQVRGVQPAYRYWELDYEHDFMFISEESFSNKRFLKGGFITLTDNDGELNYIPVRNIVCMEVDRRLVITDEDWHQIELAKHLNRSQN